MTSLLDAIKAQQEPVSAPTEAAPLIVPADEWADFLATGYCLWEETMHGEYQHAVTGETYRWGQPFVLPGDET